MTVVRLPRPYDRSDPARPRVLHAHLRHAPQAAPCPHCGRPGRRKQLLRRTARCLAYRAVRLVHVTTAEYRAACDCCATFRTQVEGVAPKAKYTDRVREAVLDRLLDDRMTVPRIRAALRRDFLLELSDGFVYDCLAWKARQLDGAAYRAWAVAHFSGTLCIDELYLGAHALLLATDPLNDFPVAFALVRDADQAHLGRFLRQLRDHGLHPRVVVTDGSPLYPAVLARVWPRAGHQLCAFHALRDLNQQVLKAVRRVGRALVRRGRQGPRRRARGRRERPKHRGRARLVLKKAYLIVKRRDRLTAGERRELAALVGYAPALAVLRSFADEASRLFEASQPEQAAWRRRAALLGEAPYRAVPELAKALGMLAEEKFAKMVAFLRAGAGRGVRTNNHVERMNRALRLYEKARYKWRTARSKVRFVCLLIDRRWGERARRWQGDGGAATPTAAAGRAGAGRGRPGEGGRAA